MARRELTEHAAGLAIRDRRGADQADHYAGRSVASCRSLCHATEGSTMTSRAAAHPIRARVVRRGAEGSGHPAGRPRPRRLRRAGRRSRCAREDPDQPGDSSSEEEGRRRPAPRAGRIDVADRRQASAAAGRARSTRLAAGDCDRLSVPADGSRASRPGRDRDRCRAAGRSRRGAAAGTGPRDRASGSAREPRRSVDHWRRHRAGWQHRV